MICLPLVILSPSAFVILSEAKNLSASRVNSAKDLLFASCEVCKSRSFGKTACEELNFKFSQACRKHLLSASG